MVLSMPFLNQMHSSFPILSSSLVLVFVLPPRHSRLQSLKIVQCQEVVMVIRPRLRPLLPNDYHYRFTSSPPPCYLPRHPKVFKL
jgi:hypothetical protein